MNTSEFNDVKDRLAMLHNRRKIDNQDPNRPTLRKAPGSGHAMAGWEAAQRRSSDAKRRPDADSN